MGGYLTRIVRSGATPLSTIDRMPAFDAQTAVPPSIEVEETVTRSASSGRTSSVMRADVEPPPVADAVQAGNNGEPSHGTLSRPIPITLDESPTADAFAAVSERFDPARLARGIESATREQGEVSSAHARDPVFRSFPRAPRFEVVEHVLKTSPIADTAPAPLAHVDRTGMSSRPMSRPSSPTTTSSDGENDDEPRRQPRVAATARPAVIQAEHSTSIRSASASAAAVAPRRRPEHAAPAIEADALGRDPARVAPLIAAEAAQSLARRAPEPPAEGSVTIDRLEIQLVEPQPAAAPPPAPAPRDDWSAPQRLAAARLW